MSIIPQDKTKNKAFKLKLEQCRRYHDKGFSLIPLVPRGKKPDAELLEGGKWKPYRQRRASWPEVESWLNDKPDINIGIITGKASNLAVIDVDHPLDTEGNQRIEISDEIDTPRVQTARSQHIYFRTDEDVGYRTLKAGDHTVGELIADSKHYVVAPPSIHPTGPQYQWQEKNSLIRTELEEFTDIDINTKYITKQSVAQEILLLVKPNVDEVNQERDTSVDTIQEQESVQVAKRRSINKQSGNWWQQLQKEPEVAKKVLKLAGVDVKGLKLGKAFSCPFHPEKEPSAALYMVDEDEMNEDVTDRYIGFADFHKKGRPKWYNPEDDGDVLIDEEDESKPHWFNLGEVYFAIETGKDLQKLDAGVGVVWWLRALDAIGEINHLPSVQARKLPEPDQRGNYSFRKEDEDGEVLEYLVSQASVKKVYDGFKYLLQLRSLYDDKQVGTPFSHRFAAGWCDVSVPTVGKAMRYLMQRGFITVAEKTEGQRANILDLNRR